MIGLRVFIALCLGIEALLWGADLGLWGQAGLWRSFAIGYGGFWPSLWLGWQSNYPGQGLIMFLSYGLLHSGPLHALTNMVSCHSVGRMVLARSDGRGLVLAGLAGQIGGGVFYLGFVALRPLIGLAPEAAPMVGASGMLFGLAGVLIGWAARAARAAGESLVPVGQAVLWLVALNLGLWVVTAGQLAWSCHLGGALAGVLVARLRPEKGH